MLLKPSFGEHNLGNASRSEVCETVQGLLGNTHLFMMEAVLVSFNPRSRDRLKLHLPRKLSMANSFI